MNKIFKFIKYNLFYSLYWKWHSFYHYIIKPFHIIKYGFPLSDLWSLDYTLSKWIVPRLKYFRNNIQGTPIKKDGKWTEEGPEYVTIEEWQKILDEMIFAFEFTIKDVSGDFYYDDKQWGLDNQRRKRGLKLFAEYFNDLWD